MAPQRLLPVEQRRELKQRIDNYISGFNFGLIQTEVLKYIRELFPTYNFTSAAGPKIDIGSHCYSFHSQTPAWSVYAMALLQAGQGGSGNNVSRFQHERGSYAKRNLLSARLTNKTEVLAANKIAALSRVFFEIDDVFETMKREKDVALGCGYAILWLLYEQKEPLSMPDIMERLQYPNTKTVERNVFMDSKIHPLREQGFLAEHNEFMELTEPVRIALSLMEQGRADIRNLLGRVKWFYPTRKREYEKPAEPTVLTEPPKYLPPTSGVERRQVSYPF